MEVSDCDYGHITREKKGNRWSHAFSPQNFKELKRPRESQPSSARNASPINPIAMTQKSSQQKKLLTVSQNSGSIGIFLLFTIQQNVSFPHRSQAASSGCLLSSCQFSPQSGASLTILPHSSTQKYLLSISHVAVNIPLSQGLEVAQ